MPELLLELFSEEIPARMQTRAAADLAQLVTEALKARGLDVRDAKSFATPRRLALSLADVPAQSPAISEERKGPRVGAPEPALQGFLKAAGLTSIEQATVVSDAKKGDYYIARIDKPGRAAAEIIAEAVPDVLHKFPWPKSMRWGSGTFQWVRPLKSIVCMLGGKLVPFEVAGIMSGDVTHGHRFHGGDAITLDGTFAGYESALSKAKVVLSAEARVKSIGEQARTLAKKAKLELVEDEALLNENAGLTEWPVVLMGTFDEAFLSVPGEVLTTSMKQHQKCFSLRDKKSGKLANKFILVSNLEATDGGKAIIAGNEKVIRARLSDAKFFWDQDLAKPLDEMASALSDITFHEKLGTQAERVERIAELAYQIAGACDADPEDARRAAQLCKADLVSGMVGEFPELQGLMGRYYAEAGGIKPETARAIELHYKPKGPTDSVPLEESGDAVAVAVALADKLDTLVGFWAINEKPTGSGDPYQLRRAALGVIRLLLENDLRLNLGAMLESAPQSHFERMHNVGRLLRIDRAMKPIKDNPYLVCRVDSNVDWETLREQQLFYFDGDIRDFEREDATQLERSSNEVQPLAIWAGISGDLLSFFADRLKVYLRDKGARHDLIDAVFALPGQDDLALIVKRVEALGDFLKTDDGANLLAGAKRAANILAIEEKKDKRTYGGDIDGSLLQEPAERGLDAAIAKVKFDTQAAINVENFAGAMRALAELRAPVDAFFETVIVNAPDPKLRENRLKLLSEIRAATLTVADFSKIAG